MASFSVNYKYDGAGNRLTETDNLTGQTTNYAYDAANRLLTIDAPDGITTFTYDASGNRTRKETPSSITDYTYDAKDRLIKVEPISGDVEFTYNAAGVRVHKETAGEVTKFLYDHENLLQETDADGLTQRAYTQSTEEYGDLISQHADDATAYPEFDAQWSTAALLDENESVTDRYRYRAFGIADHEAGSSSQSLTFVGKRGYYRDDELDLYFARARYYDPEAGRWLTKDPLGLAAGDNNLYRYVENNPVNKVDPSGKAGMSHGSYRRPPLSLGGTARDVSQNELVTLQELTWPAQYVLSKSGRSFREILAMAKGFSGDVEGLECALSEDRSKPLDVYAKVRGWVSVIDVVEKERAEKQKQAIDEIAKAMSEAKQAAKEYYERYDLIEDPAQIPAGTMAPLLSKVRPEDFKATYTDSFGPSGIDPYGIGFGSGTLNRLRRSIVVIRMPRTKTFSRPSNLEQLGVNNDPRVWLYYISDEYCPEDPKSAADLTPAFKAYRVKDGRDPYKIWTSVTDGNEYADTIISQVESIEALEAIVSHWEKIADFLDFTLNLLPFGGTFEKLTDKSHQWTTADIIQIAMDSALLLTGVGGAFSGVARLAKIGAIISRVGKVIEIGAATFQAYDAVSTIRGIDPNDPKATQQTFEQYARLFEALFILGGHAYQAAKQKRAALLGEPGKGPHSGGKIEEANELGVKTEEEGTRSLSDISCRCFAAGTQVQIPTGSQAIETFEAGDVVWSRSEKTGEWSFDEVVTLHTRTHEGDMISVDFGEGEFEATASHPIWACAGEDIESRPLFEHCDPCPADSCVDGRWVQACDLRPGDTLATRSGRTIRVVRIQRRTAKIHVFNLQIRRLATYAVAECGIWVHNASGEPCDLPKGKLPSPNLKPFTQLTDAEKDKVLDEIARHVVEDSGRYSTKKVARAEIDATIVGALEKGTWHEGNSGQVRYYYNDTTLFVNPNGEGTIYLDLGGKDFHRESFCDPAPNKPGG